MGMMTEILNERRILTNVRLTDHQKAVLARTKNAQTPRIATDDTKKNTSMVTARDQLAKLGLITFDGVETTLTPQGEQLMKDESLIDDMGELTDSGTESAYDDKDQPDGQPDEMGDTPGDDTMSDPMGPMGSTPPQGGTPPIPPALETFDLLKSLSREIPYLLNRSTEESDVS